MFSPSTQPRFNPDTQQRLLKYVADADPIIADTRLRSGTRFVSALIGEFPTAYVSVNFDAGSRRDEPGARGASHFFEHLPYAAFRLANDGLDLGEYPKKRGWGFKIVTTLSSVTFGFTCPDFDVEDALRVLGEIINYDRQLLNSVFETERQRILNEIDQDSADGNKVLWNNRYRLLMANSIYAHPITGERDEVSAHTFEQVIRQRDLYFSPENAMCVACGSREVISQAQSFFTGMSFPSKAAKAVPVDASGRRPWNEVPRESTNETSAFKGVELEILMAAGEGHDTRDKVIRALVQWGIGKSILLNDISELGCIFKKLV